MSLRTRDRIPLSIRWPVISTVSEDGTVVPRPVVGRGRAHRRDQVAEAADEGADEERARPSGGSTPAAGPAGARRRGSRPARSRPAVGAARPRQRRRRRRDEVALVLPGRARVERVAPPGLGRARREGSAERLGAGGRPAGGRLGRRGGGPERPERPGLWRRRHGACEPGCSGATVAPPARSGTSSVGGSQCATISAKAASTSSPGSGPSDAAGRVGGHRDRAYAAGPEGRASSVTRRTNVDRRLEDRRGVVVQGRDVVAVLEHPLLEVDATTPWT